MPYPIVYARLHHFFRDYPDYATAAMRLLPDGLRFSAATIHKTTGDAVSHAIVMCGSQEGVARIDVTPAENNLKARVVVERGDSQRDGSALLSCSHDL